MKKLLVISSAPAAQLDGKPYLDIKFCEGMRYYCAAWGGPVTSILRAQQATFPFGQPYDRTELPFELRLISNGRQIDRSVVEEFDVVVCGGDNHEYLHLADACSEIATKLVYNIEYSLKTRFQIIFLDRKKSVPRKAYSALWILNQERRRRRAFKLADGLQANGYPAMAQYGRLKQGTVLYLDNRIGTSLLATRSEMSARSTRTAGPIRILNSGRLETMKGAQDLIPIANYLSVNKIDFELDIFGTGSLESEIRRSIEETGLMNRVRLHKPVDFETELVPFARRHADIFLSCNRQSDPSCSYIESMGCGLPIAGYANDMWASLLRESGGGWIAPLGDWQALAERIAQIATNREAINQKSERALAFASDHRFEIEFRRRIDHLKSFV